jgi:hypothetical protein
MMDENAALALVTELAVMATDAERQEGMEGGTDPAVREEDTGTLDALILRARAIAGAAVAALAIGALIIGCAPGHAAADKARASAAATSTVVQTGKQDAKALLLHCIPASTMAQVQLLEPKKGKSARAAVAACMGVPEAARQVAAACVLGNAEATAKLPKGKRPKGKQAVEEALLNDAYPCVKRYQDASPPTASAK